MADYQTIRAGAGVRTAQIDEGLSRSALVS